MMKLLGTLFLLCIVLGAGCSPPSGSIGDKNDPELTSDLEPVDQAAESAAAKTATGR